MRMGFPEAVDSTMIAAYRNCPQEFKNAYVERLRLKGESVHLIAGAAFAKGIEVVRSCYYEHGMSPEDSLAEGLKALVIEYGDFECPEGENKTLPRMMGALEYYFENYPLPTDRAQVKKIGNRWGVEFSFAIPLPYKHPETGQPILFAGRSDAIVDYAGGTYLCDEKTTKQLGATWSKQWDLRAQFTAYAWALQHQLGITPAGSLIRGVSILKTKYETQEAVVGQPAWKIKRWEDEMHRTMQAMLRDYAAGDWGYDLGEACNHYGGCAFKTLCNAPDPEPWINTYYEHNDWSPLDKLRDKKVIPIQPQGAA